MKQKFLLSILLLSTVFQSKALDVDEIKYWVGNGQDTAILVIGFLDATEDSSYAWGYLFDATQNVTAEMMLNDISLDEPTLSVTIGGGFLSDIIYNSHSGIGGTPNFWGTWSATNGGSWTSNTGLGEVLANGSWFGCSYTDFNPALLPGAAIPAYDSKGYYADQTTFWIGTGNDTALFVIDFVESNYGEAVSYTWGFAFDGTTTGGEMLTAIAAADGNLDIDAGSFLNDIIYGSLEGLAGMPYYWGTWSGTNLSDWTMNSGLSEPVTNGDWFGCSYADWAPRRPVAPFPAVDPQSFNLSNVAYWVGTGTDSTVIVVDFIDGEPGVAFGHVADGAVSAETALTNIAAIYSELTVAAGGGFLNDITYQQQEGIGGTDGNYWATWSGENIGAWELNGGLSESLSNGDWFACTFTDFAPALPPTTPNAAMEPNGINEAVALSWNVNVANRNISVSVSSETDGQFNIYDLAGNMVLSSVQKGGTNHFTLNDVTSGVYLIRYVNKNANAAKRILLF